MLLSAIFKYDVARLKCQQDGTMPINTVDHCLSHDVIPYHLSLLTDNLFYSDSYKK